MIVDPFIRETFLSSHHITFPQSPAMPDHSVNSLSLLNQIVPFHASFFLLCTIRPLSLSFGPHGFLLYTLVMGLSVHLGVGKSYDYL